MTLWLALWVLGSIPLGIVIGKWLKSRDLPDPEHETCDGLPDGDRSARPEFPLSHEDEVAND